MPKLKYLFKKKTITTDDNITDFHSSRDEEAIPKRREEFKPQVQLSHTPTRAFPHADLRDGFQYSIDSVGQVKEPARIIEAPVSRLSLEEVSEVGRAPPPLLSALTHTEAQATKYPR